jgi:predicted dehydrogenase
MAGLLRALESGAEPDISGRDNLRTIALCEAVMKGASEHRAVTLDEIARE